MARYKRRGKFKRRKLSRRTLGRRGFRKFRRASKRFMRKSLFLPKGPYMPKYTFVKLHQTIIFDKANVSPPGGYVVDTVLRGNSLHDWAEIGTSSNSDDTLRMPVWQLAQLYEYYYVYKSQVKMWINNNSTPSSIPIPMVAYIAPSLQNNLPYDYSTVNYTGNGSPPEDFPKSRTKHFNDNYMKSNGKPLVLKNTATTKRMVMLPKPKLDDTFLGSIQASGTLASPTYQCGHPTRQWYWHLGVVNQNETGAANTITYRFVVKMSYWVRFSGRREPLQNVAEFNVEEG